MTMKANLVFLQTNQAQNMTLVKIHQKMINQLIIVNQPQQ